MGYIETSLNHFRAARAACEAAGATATMDFSTFALEVKARNRYYRLLPRFLSVEREQLVHAHELTGRSIGFIGWLPYQGLRWELSSDKLKFKHFMTESGERAPAAWTKRQDVQSDFIRKNSVGSFGYGFEGPFHHDAADTGKAEAPRDNDRGERYMEQFIVGKILKVWYWGAHPFHVHAHDYPVVTGDGKQNLRQLVAARIEKEWGRTFDENATHIRTIKSVLAYQGHSMDTVPDAGTKIWIDYRYGRHYNVKSSLPVSESDDAWPGLAPTVHEQCMRAGTLLAKKLSQQFPAPVLYSVDGVLDAQNQIWWLEMNSNPIFPPTGYTPMLESLLGPKPAPPGPPPAPPAPKP